MLSGRLLSYSKKEKLSEMAIHCHSLSFIATRCHSLSLDVALACRFVNNPKNSTTFSNSIRNVTIEDDEIMVSFDITSLYTNILIIDTNQGLCLIMMINLLGKQLYLPRQVY